jgi:hypothetical protein
MRKLFYIIPFFMVFAAASARGEYLPTNADFLRTLNRNASVGSIDSVFFNPAGSMRLTDGLYFHVGNQFDIFYQKTEESGQKASAIGVLAAMPDFAMLMTRAGYAFFFTIDNTASTRIMRHNVEVYDPAGTTTLTANKSTYLLQWVEATLGGAYAFNDYISLSFGLRLLMPIGYTHLDVDTTAGDTAAYHDFFVGYGFGAQASLLFTPIKPLAISVMYKTESAAATSHFVSKDDNSVLSTLPENNYNGLMLYPAQLRTGIAYTFGENFSLEGNFNLIFEQERDFFPVGGTLQPAFGGNGFGMQAGLGFDWRIMPSLTWGLGALFSFNNKNYDSFDNSSNSMVTPQVMTGRYNEVLAGTGFSINFENNVRLKLSLAVPLMLGTPSGALYLQPKVNVGVSFALTDIFQSSHPAV